jgi:Fe2+ transport system protein FeoA
MRDKDTLESLLPGQSGTIVSVSNTNNMVRRRLIDMGLTPGTKVKVKKIRPFGDLSRSPSGDMSFPAKGPMRPDNNR